MGLAGTALQYAINDASPKATQREDGTWAVEDLKVFKASTFKDSKGRQKTWTPDELDAMVTNYNKLRGGGFLVDVPVREDHTQSVEKVKGYFTGMRADGEFLYANVEFTEPDGAEKFNRGTYRARSMEIGTYETNGTNPKSYWPVATGLAFVDIGAVEGLFSAHREEQENSVKFKINGVEAEYSAEDVQKHIDGLENKAPEAPHTFRVNGADESDYAKTQAYIDTLETFRAEATEAGRTTAVDALLAENKIAAPQAEGLKEFVKTLTSTQFDAWKAQYDNAPRLFNATAGDGNGRPNGAPDPALDEAATAQAVVSMHRQGGMREEQVRETESFRRYVALTGKQPE